VTAWAGLGAALARQGLAARDCLFRSTEGFNLNAVLAHGTDRHGREQAGFCEGWAAGGYRGPPRPFDRVIFASTAAEIARQLRTGEGDTALSKCPDTEGAVLLVYRRADLVRVHRRQYAFRARRCPDARTALLAVFPVAELPGMPLASPLRRLFGPIPGRTIEPR